MRPPCFVAICSKPPSPRPTRASTVMKHSRPWIDKAARLAFGIAQAQAYEDGNKRLAWLCTAPPLPEHSHYQIRGTVSSNYRRGRSKHGDPLPYYSELRRCNDASLARQT